jgi:hypothetical protein
MDAATGCGQCEGVIAMFVLLVVIAAVAVSAPMVAALIVSVASRREDRNWSLGGPARSSLEEVARRIVAFDNDSIVWPRSKAHERLAAALRRDLPETIEPTDCATRHRIV